MSSLDRFLADRWNAVEADYRWSLPSALPPFARNAASAPSLFAATTALRDVCISAFQDDPMTVAAWWVKTWGGVKGNAPERIAAYVALAQLGAIPDKLSGVASWSKVFAIANADRFAIFDARVSMSLNAIAMRDDNPTSWVLLPNRNRRILAAQRILKSRGSARSCNPYTPSGQYRTYLSLLPSDRCDRHRAEMILFTYAEELADEIVARGA